MKYSIATTIIVGANMARMSSADFVSRQTRRRASSEGLDSGFGVDSFESYSMSMVGSLEGVAAPTSNKSSKASKKGPAGFVFTMTNSAAGNEIIMYDRDGTTGRLTYPRHFATGGIGGDSILESPPDDPLASQGSLTVTSGGCLLAVNAGSDTVTSFKILSNRVEAISLVGSGGDTPVSIAANNDGLVYVLNAGGPGSIKGFHIEDECHLEPINNSIVSLNQALLQGRQAPFFVSSPAQVGFTPDGSELIVTIKGIDGNPGAGGTINRFEVNDDGHLGDINVFETGVNSIVPFSFDFDGNDNLIVVDAFGDSAFGDGDAGSVTMYGSGAIGDELTVLANIGVGATAACWLKYNNGCAYTTNNVSSTISSIRVEDTSLSLVNSEEASLNNPTDQQLSDDGKFLYALSTGHTTDGQPRIYAYKRNGDCTLDQVQVIEDGLPDEDTTVFGVMGLAIF